MSRLIAVQIFTMKGRAYTSYCRQILSEEVEATGIWEKAQLPSDLLPPRVYFLKFWELPKQFYHTVENPTVLSL